MSALAVSVPTPRTPAPSTRRRAVTVRRLTLAEWTKFRTLRSLRAVLALTMLLIAVPGLLVPAATVVQLDTLSAEARATFDPASAALSGVALAVLAAGVLGTLMMGSEYSTGSLRTLVIVAPRRWDALLAKAIVLCAVMVPATTTVTAGTYVGAQQILASKNLDAPIDAQLLVNSASVALALTTSALLGLALVTVIRRTTGAIALILTVLLIVPTLTGLVPGTAGHTVQKFLPSTAVNRLAVPSPGPLRQRNLDSTTTRWAVLNKGIAATGGISVSVIRRDGTALSSAAGAQPDGAPLADGSILHMGSITKTYVAVALVRAEAAGLVDLDAPLRRYVSGAPGAAGVTVRQILQMRSGIPDYLDGDAWKQAVTADPARVWSLHDVLTLVPDRAGQPGPFAYSNTNYILAGLVLERVTGKDWRAAIQDLVLDPLRLSDTHPDGEGRTVAPATFDDGNGARLSTAATSYRAVETSSATAGAMVSTAEDLARLGEALLDRQRTSAQQWHELTTFGGPPAYYGMGLADFAATTRFNGGPGPHAIGNNGEIPGYGATLLMYPRSGVSIAVMRNDDKIDAYALATEIAGALGVDLDPEERTSGQAALLALAYIVVLGAGATTGLTRRDA